MINRRTAVLAAIASAAFAAPIAAAVAQDNPMLHAPHAGPPPLTDNDPALIALIGGPQRSAANKARDPWRHPVDTLGFWGLQPGLVVADIDPGGGYWTEIVAPYVAQGGGRYIAGMTDPNDPAASDGAKRARAAFEAKYADHAVYGPIAYAPFSIAGGFRAPPGSIDLIIYSRYVHDLMGVPGALQRALGDFYSALRPSGILAVEEHRADPRAMVPNATDGYVATDFVIGEARKAGFVFERASEINANPKDTKDHPFGVWTLPPTRRSAPAGQPPNPAFDHARYDAIGESDRMTLRFRKPASA
ncbi:MAG TPA: methyltransferase [Caulobacteraceae bacterium]|jgi:predicted methyltransferase|nr:methyltransferase [Caulobacteraceae bacterium]